MNHSHCYSIDSIRVLLLLVFTVGEDEEISIKEAVDVIVDAMKFTGPVTVSLV